MPKKGSRGGWAVPATTANTSGSASAGSVPTPRVARPVPAFVAEPAGKTSLSQGSPAPSGVGGTPRLQNADPGGLGVVPHPAPAAGVVSAPLLAPSSLGVQVNPAPLVSQPTTSMETNSAADQDLGPPQKGKNKPVLIKAARRNEMAGEKDPETGHGSCMSDDVPMDVVALSPKRKRDSDGECVSPTKKDRLHSRVEPPSDGDSSDSEDDLQDADDGNVANDSMPSLAADMNLILNVDGNDDQNKKDNDDSFTAARSSKKKGGARHRTGFRVEVAMPPAPTTAPTVQAPTQQAGAPSSYAGAAQQASDEEEHVLIVTSRGDEVRAAVPDHIYKDLDKAIHKEITRMTLEGKDDTVIPAVNWLAKNGAVTKIACGDEDTVAWVKAYVRRWDEAHAEAHKSALLGLRAWTKIEMPEHDTIKIIMPLNVYDAVGKANILRVMLRQNRLPGKPWMMSDIASGQHRVLVIGVDEELATALKNRGLQVRIAARRFTLTYQVKRKVSDSSME